MGTISTVPSRSSTRYYIHPDLPDQRVPSVTSFLDIIDKPALKRWAALTVATYAVEHHESWSGLPAEDAIKLLKGVPWDAAKRSADTGTAAHAYAESRLTGLPAEPDNVACQNVDMLLAELKARGATMIDQEVTVWSDRHAYAGTFDLLVKMEGELWLLDWKTSKAVYPDMALQLAAYVWADWAVMNDGSRLALRGRNDDPIITRAAVLWVPKTGKGKIVEMPVGPTEFAAVLSARNLFGWKAGH